MSKAKASFHFQNFSIDHQLSAHKIGTDAILLGAWLPPGDYQHIFEFGSGCGVISFILAQRFPKSQITGIEIDAPSWSESESNRLKQNFAQRLNFVKGDLLEAEFSQKFDLLISNPPYFIESLESPVKSRAIARNSSAKLFAQWILKFKTLIKEEGEIALILPWQGWLKYHDEFKRQGLFPKLVCSVRHHQNSKTSRALLLLSPQETQNSRQEEIYLYEREGKHRRSPQFQELVKNLLRN